MYILHLFISPGVYIYICIYIYIEQLLGFMYMLFSYLFLLVCFVSER